MWQQKVALISDRIIKKISKHNFGQQNLRRQDKGSVILLKWLSIGMYKQN